MCPIPARSFAAMLSLAVLATSETAVAAVRITMPAPPSATRQAPATGAAPQRSSTLAVVEYTEMTPSANDRDEVDVTDVGSLARARYARGRTTPDLTYINGRSSYSYNGPTYFHDNWGWPFWWFGFSCSPCNSHGSCK